MPTLPTWSTDVNFTGGPDVGTPVKIEPSVGRRAEGFVPGDLVPAQHVNWLFSEWSLYLAYLKGERDLSATELLRLAALIGGAVGADEWLYTTPRTRVILISLAGAKSAIDHNATSGLVTVNHHWDQLTTDEWRSRKDSGVLLIPLNPYLVQGCDILRVRAVVASGADRAGANRLSVTLKKVTADFDGPTRGTTAAMAATWYEAETYTAAVQVIDSAPIDKTINRFGVDHYLSIVAGSDGGTNFDKVHAVELTIRDYGPRNA